MPAKKTNSSTPLPMMPITGLPEMPAQVSPFR